MHEPSSSNIIMYVIFHHQLCVVIRIRIKAECRPTAKCWSVSEGGGDSSRNELSSALISPLEPSLPESKLQNFVEHLRWVGFHFLNPFRFSAAVVYIVVAIILLLLLLSKNDRIAERIRLILKKSIKAATPDFCTHIGESNRRNIT